MTPFGGISDASEKHIVIAPNKTNLTSAGATIIPTGHLYRVIVNTGVAGATIELEDSGGTFATIAADDPSVDRAYDVRVIGDLTVTITGTPDVTITHD